VLYDLHITTFTTSADGAERAVRQAGNPVDHQDSLYITAKELPSILLFGAPSEAYRIPKADLMRL